DLFMCQFPAAGAQRDTLIRTLAKRRAPPGLAAWTKGGPARWTAPIVTRGELADGERMREGASETKGGANAKPQATVKANGKGQAVGTASHVVDTLTVPYANPHNALFFLTGVDFLPSGDIAVCTAHGDVWLVKGADAKLEKLTWKRFATGLYQPL